MVIEIIYNHTILVVIQDCKLLEVKQYLNFIECDTPHDPQW